MPVEDYECEFCCEVHRKDRIAEHIKKNHKVEIGKYLMEVYEGSRPDSKMNDFLAKYITTNFEGIDIIRGFYSDKYSENAEEYLFGSSPFFYSGTPQDDKKIHSYKTAKANIEAHYQFIKECIATIPLTDFIRCQRVVNVTSDENVQFLKQRGAMRSTIKELEKKVETLERYNEQLRSSEKKAIEKATECAEVLKMDIDDINAMRTNNRYLCSENARLESMASNHRRIVDELNTEWEGRYASMNYTKLKESDELYSKIEKLTKDYDKVKDKIKSEAEKIIQKEKEKKRKEKEKEKKKAKEAERKAEEARLIAKLISKKSKSQKYDTDSDSDSDSDSSTSSGDTTDSD
jgi:uncharacterized protein YukE